MLKFLTTCFATFSLLAGTVLLAACDYDSSSDAPMELAGTTEVDELVLAAAADDDRLVTLSLVSNQTQVALNILELNDDGTLQELGSLTAPGDGYNLTSFNASGLTVDDGVAYVALPRSDQSAIWAVDISDPENPAERSLFEIPDAMPVSIATSDDLAAVGTGLIGAGVTLADVSNPNDIQRIGMVEHAAVSTAKVGLAEDYVYLVDMSGVTVIDVSDSQEPVEAGFYENPIWGGIPGAESGETNSSTSSTDRPGLPDIAVADDHLLMTTGADTLEILDTDDPANIESVAQVETGFASMAVTVSDDFAYVYSRGELEFGEPMSDVPFTLQKVDVSDAGDPEVVEELEIDSTFPSPYQSLVAGDEHLFVLKGQSIDVITISG